MTKRGKRNNMLGDLGTGLLIGAGAMYFMDPDRGRRRRAAVRDMGIHLANQMDDAVDTTARDLRNRSQGMVARTRSRFEDHEAPDHVLDARVRARLGRLVSHPSAIRTEVENGIVTLRGDVLADELSDLLSGVEHVPGITGVRNDLNAHAEPGDVPGLQGNARRPEMRPELLQENWTPAARLVAAAVGGALTLTGSAKEGPTGALMVMAGATLLARAVTNLEMKRLTGVNAGRRAIDVQKTITVHAPVEEVFGFWTRLENLPRFMSHLREVRPIDDKRSHWTAEGPGGVSVSWDAEITAFTENAVIGWKSIGTSPVGNAGIIRFEKIDDQTTRMDVHMSYNPPAGALGHVVASFFGVDPKHAMDEDLVRFKSLLEDGKTHAHGHKVERGELAGMGTAG